MPTCKFCGEPFRTAANLQKHQSQAPDCLKKVEDEFLDISRLRREQQAKANWAPFSTCGNTDFGPTYNAEVEMPLAFLSDDSKILLPQDSRAETDVHVEPVNDWDATAPTNMVHDEGQD